MDIMEVESSLMQLVAAIERGESREFVIIRDGRPIAKLVSIKDVPPKYQIGVAKGKFEVPESIDMYNEEVARLFLCGAR